MSSGTSNRQSLRSLPGRWGAWGPSGQTNPVGLWRTVPLAPFDGYEVLDVDGTWSNGF